MPKPQPPSYFFFCLAASIILDFVLPVYAIAQPYHYGGVLIFIIGAVLTIWTDQLFKKYKTTVKPGQESKKLIITGPYKYSRNPMYLGMLLILLGVSCFLGSAISFLSPLAFYLIMNFKFIPLEEKMLQQKFGQQFTEYKKQTRTWL